MTDQVKPAPEKKSKFADQVSNNSNKVNTIAPIFSGFATKPAFNTTTNVFMKPKVASLFTQKKPAAFISTVTTQQPSQEEDPLDALMKEYEKDAAVQEIAQPQSEDKPQNVISLDEIMGGPGDSEVENEVNQERVEDEEPEED